MPTYRVPVNLSWNGAGSPGANVWHVRTTSELGVDGPELQAATDAIRAFYVDLQSITGIGTPLYASSLKMTLGTVVDVESSEEVVPTFAAIDVGSGWNNAPPSNQICITWKTSLAARRGRGRTFLGPLNSSIIQADGTVLDSALTDVRTAAANLVAASAASNGWAIGVYGQENLMSGAGVTPEMRRAAPHVLRDIIGSKVQDKFAVLRSRRD